MVSSSATSEVLNKNDIFVVHGCCRHSMRMVKLGEFVPGVVGVCSREGCCCDGYPYCHIGESGKKNTS